MAILTTDVDIFLSGGASNSDQHAALGGIRSTTTELNPVVGEENLFRNVDGAEASAGSIKFRGLYFENGHASLTLEGTKYWIITQPTNAKVDIDIALAGEGLNATMETVSDEDTAPIGETFTAPATKAAGLSMGDVPTLQHFGFWIRRTVTSGALAQNDDDYDWRIEGDTAA